MSVNAKERDGDMRTFFCWTMLASVVLVGCGKGKDSRSGALSSAPEGLNSARVDVPSGQVVSGFRHGKLRKELKTSAFAISESPITLGQFRTCLEDGPCAESPASCSNGEGHDGDAALCVGLQNAEAYCSWSGGRLATLSEWFLAARGRSPQRFSWGEGAPTCEQHPRARRPREEQHEELDMASSTECGDDLSLVHRVERHAAGASPSGLEDVLLTPGELLAGDRESNFGVCRGEERRCVVYGLVPGAIDSVKAASDSDGEHPYTFRCVWTEEEA